MANVSSSTDGPRKIRIIRDFGVFFGTIAMVTALCLMVERTMKAKRRGFFVCTPLDQLWRYMN
ncbi:hypothetical protein P5673_001454 [Acropora cervicornis]|uniref:Uncharacterized protein n=1 Tax=Acropora cervicornis TaxID=6130 RepID=A0AAD9R640_ACRCE|nr:hypothetical protein P5673_001454 [Acropora cervicornis]